MQVESFVLLEFFNQPFHDALVEVVAAQMGVAVGGFHFDDAFADFEDRDVERAAAKVVHGDGFVLLLVQAVSERRRRGLVDDALHVQPGDLSGIFGRLALRVVEVRGDGDHRVGDLLAEEILRGVLQFLKDHRRNLRRAILFALRQHGDVVALADYFVGHHLHFFADFVVAPAHETLDRVNGVFGIGDRLPLGHLANQALPGLGDADDRRGSSAAFLVGDDDRFAALHHGDHRVGRAQVNSNNLAHWVSSFSIQNRAKWRVWRGIRDAVYRLSVLLSNFLIACKPLIYSRIQGICVSP